MYARKAPRRGAFVLFMGRGQAGTKTCCGRASTERYVSSGLFRVSRLTWAASQVYNAVVSRAREATRTRLWSSRCLNCRNLHSLSF